MGSTEAVARTALLKDRLSEAQRIARMGSWSWDVVTDSVTWSDQLFRIYGVDPQAGPASFAGYLERVHVADRDRVAAAITRTVETLEPYETEYRIVLPGGLVRVMHARGEVTARKGPRALQLMGYCQDVTEQRDIEEKRRHAQAELAGHQRVLERIARGAPLEATLDLLCDEIESNYPGTICSVLVVEPDAGLLRDAAAPSLARSVRMALDGLPILDGGSACGTAAARNEPVVVEDALIDPLTASFTDLATQHELRSVWSLPLNNSAGEVVGTFAIYRSVPHRPDLAEQRAVSAAASLAALALERTQNLERLGAAARFDSLTGMYNRAWFINELTDRIAVGARDVAVLFLDMDGFKWINDSLGHPAGDRILIDVAERLKTAVGDDDSALARFGGDEFAVLVLDAGAGAAEDVAVRIEEAMSAPFVLDGGEFFMSVSIGIAYNDPPRSSDELIRDADTAMYVAKERAGSGHASFNSQLRDRLLNRITMEADLRRAIERDEFVMHYQPVLELRTRRWAGLESLVRWQHPTRGLLAPDLFIPFAEETGLIVPLGNRILHKVLAMAVELGDQLPPQGMGLNVSVRQLSDPHFDDDVMNALDEHGLMPESLSIEITETALMKEFSTANLSLGQLAHEGVALVVDDFGCGYSSIARLRELPVTGMKIDRSFSVDLGVDAKTDTVVRSIVDLAHALGLSVVMEGIETTIAAEASQTVGADLGQGFYFARPLPGEDLIDALDRPFLPRADAES